MSTPIVDWAVKHHPEHTGETIVGPKNRQTRWQPPKNEQLFWPGLGYNK